MSSSRAVLSIVVCGLIGVGIGVARHHFVGQSADEVVRLPGVDLTSNLPPEAPVGAATSAAVSGPQQSVFGDSGLSTTIPEGCTARGLQPGINRIVRIERGKKLVVALNRRPLYPWEDKAVVQGALNLKGWRDGPVTEPMALDLPVEGWAFEEGRLHLHTQSTVLSILIAADGTWESPDVKSALQALKVEPMRGIRETFAEAIKLAPDLGRAPASPEVVADVQKALATIRSVPPAEVGMGPTTEAGIRAFEAGSLDQLSTLILLSTLHPFVARISDGQPMPAGGTPPPDCMPSSATGSSTEPQGPSPPK